MSDEAAMPQGTASGVISLALGHPDQQSLPIAALAAAAQAALSGAQAHAMLEYGPERGPVSLVAYLVGKLNAEEALGITSDNLMIIAGSTHGIDMIARLFAGAGAGVLVETPTYKDALHIFRDHRVVLHGVPMDREGVISGAMEALLEQLQSEGKLPSLFYTIPNFHNPTGVTATTNRREAVIALARQHGIIILEDDVYRDLAFEQTVPPSYYALAGGEGVLRIGSFSKTLAPGLRLGWLIGQPPLIEMCTACGAMQMGGGANPFAAQVAAAYCESGEWPAHIDKLRAIYHQRCDVALSILERTMPEGVTWTRPNGGFFLWITLLPGMDVAAVAEKSRQRGVMFSPGPGFFVNPPDGARHLRLAFSFAEPNKIEAGIHILAGVIRKLLE